MKKNEVKLTQQLLDDAFYSVINNAYDTPGIKSENELRYFLHGQSETGFEAAGDANGLHPDEFSRKISRQQDRAFDRIMSLMLDGKYFRWMSMSISWDRYASHWNLKNCPEHQAWLAAREEDAAILAWTEEQETNR